MRTRISLLIVGSALVLSACADSAGDGQADGTASMSTAGPTETSVGDTSAGNTAPEVVTELQADLEDLQEAIAESEAAQDLNAAWMTLSAEVTASMAAIREDGTIAREEIESGLEDFEQRLDELDVEEDVRTAWESLRSQVEQLMTTS
jgi:uncharacterized membrane protein YccC